MQVRVYSKPLPKFAGLVLVAISLLLVPVTYIQMESGGGLKRQWYNILDRLKPAEPYRIRIELPEPSSHGSAESLDPGIDEPDEIIVTATQIAPPNDLLSNPSSGEGIPDDFDSRGLLNLDYDLARVADVPDSLGVTKPLAINGSAASPIPVKILAGATVTVSRTEILERLAEANADLPRSHLLPDVEHVSFSQLREAGLAVSYDPITDTIRVNSDR